MQPNIPYFLQCLMINGASKILVIPKLSFGSTTDLPLDVLLSSVAVCRLCSGHLPSFMWLIW